MGDTTPGVFGEPEAPQPDEPADQTKPFDVTGSVDATDQHDAYKLLQAHFLALSRGDAGTLDGVQVQIA